jgi:hypothetical protein
LDLIPNYKNQTEAPGETFEFTSTLKNITTTVISSMD